MLLSFFFFAAIVTTFPILLSHDHICNRGHLWEAHGSFVVFLILLTLLEALALRSVKRRLKDQPQLFPLSKCSVMWKLGTSALARADLYTDVCFLVILYHCEHYLFAWSLISLIMSLALPLVLLFNSLLASRGCPSFFNRTLEFKRLERMARISYMTDFKVLGAVFGSYCADLKLQCCCKELSVPRLSALNRLILEDSVQTVIQIIYVSNKIEDFNALFPIASISLTIGSFMASLFNLFITAGSKPSDELI